MTEPITLDNIISALEGHRQELEQFGARSLAVFGSVARGEASAESDVDVLVEFGGAATFDRYMGLKEFLEDLLGREVDLVTRRALKPRLAPSIEAEAVYVAR